MSRPPEDNYRAIRKIAARLLVDYRGRLDDATIVEAIKETCYRELGPGSYNTAVVERAFASVLAPAPPE